MWHVCISHIFMFFRLYLKNCYKKLLINCPSVWNQRHYYLVAYYSHKQNKICQENKQLSDIYFSFCEVKWKQYLANLLWLLTFIGLHSYFLVLSDCLRVLKVETDWTNLYVAIALRFKPKESSRTIVIFPLISSKNKKSYLKKLINCLITLNTKYNRWFEFGIWVT